MTNHRVTNFCFRIGATCMSCRQAGLCVYTSGAISIRAKPTLINSSVTFWEDNAPLKLPTRHCPKAFLPLRLEFKVFKMAVSLSPPRHPKTSLQRLTTTLRIKTLKPISSYSKAPGVFSSRCRYPASSRESQFHLVRPRDSSPIVRPFMRSGTSFRIFSSYDEDQTISSSLLRIE